MKSEEIEKVLKTISELDPGVWEQLVAYESVQALVWLISLPVWTVVALSLVFYAARTLDRELGDNEAEGNLPFIMALLIIFSVVSFVCFANLVTRTGDNVATYLHPEAAALDRLKGVPE
mgnify:CR=1 FL=1